MTQAVSINTRTVQCENQSYHGCSGAAYRKLDEDELQPEIPWKGR